MANIIREDHGAVARLTLNRPDALNALSESMLADFQLALDTLEQDRAIRVIVIAGSGRAFCAGHDLKEMTEARAEPDGGAARFRALFDACAGVMQTLPRLPQPVIAEIGGLATAAGCQLVASCDLAVTAETAKFGVNGVNIGLFCSTPMVALSRNIPRKQAFELLTTGGFISADRALDLGLVNRVVAPEEVKAQSMALADTIAAKLGSAVRVGKRTFYEQIQMPLDQAYTHAGDVMVQNMLDSDTAEGIGAFLGKREPEWTQ